MDADPQANAWFMWAAYGVTAVVLVAYGLYLWRRTMRGHRGSRGLE
jgi:hypothetical protein